MNCKCKTPKPSIHVKEAFAMHEVIKTKCTLCGAEIEPLKKDENDNRI